MSALVHATWANNQQKFEVVIGQITSKVPRIMNRDGDPKQDSD